MPNSWLPWTRSAGGRAKRRNNGLQTSHRVGSAPRILQNVTARVHISFQLGPVADGNCYKAHQSAILPSKSATV